jgi:predicted PurR-regulated permease PerM
MDEPGPSVVPESTTAPAAPPAAPAPEASVATPVSAASTPRRLPPPSPRVVLLIVAAAILGVVLWMGRAALPPFVVGLLFVFVLDPFVDRLARRRVPRALAILVAYALALAVVVLVLQLTLAPLVAQVRTFIDDLPAIVAAIQTQLERWDATYRGLQLPPALRAALDAELARLAAGDIGIDPTVVLPVISATTGLVTAAVAYLVIPVWAFFLLKDRPALADAFDRSLPPAWRTDVEAILGIVRRVFTQWIRGQLFLGLVVGVATFAGLLLLGAWVDPIFARFAVLLAVIAGVLELLPIIGPILSAIPALVLAATAGIEPMVAVLLLYLAVQQLENNLLVPKIQGDATNLHPSAVILALVVGGSVAGLLGAILALPVTAAARDAYRYLFRRFSEAAES